MADNLSISITADATQLRAQLLLAQSDVRAFGSEARKLADSMRAGTAQMATAPIQLDRLAGGRTMSSCAFRCAMLIASTSPNS